MIHHGSCHCGNIVVDFETAIPPGAMPLRACACSFCRQHGARTATDRNGRMTLTFREEDTNRYVFGLRTAEFIVCRRCGVYVAAVMDGLSTINVNVLDDSHRFTQPAASRDYDGEAMDRRVARRRANWTPTSVQARGPQPYMSAGAGSDHD
jgi:hypothetical protein